jgi:hypothetical protein
MNVLGYFLQQSRLYYNVVRLGQVLIYVGNYRLETLPRGES